ncbi:putative trichothecene 3-O-acetyltransferase [Aspergillus homomorphus CBS 101889]|uniref:Putative trichothecene 3-O-acetyltransferase n=1 Tax=Aspergillus homomorphus (strain CBS 101889) TaxID=1450537 RepID=A0A395I6L3_ASPHC|nr:putative trichothecene 3-O-acetyltransferase [Aspergillus homomorphus CBS 101889]RAL15842.1 putative trichothecene 3-O-acetyltransferase [Aspergillus homomorphus CBS 101889]
MFDLSKFQDHIGQLAGLKTYTHLLLSFPIADRQSRRAAIEALYAATEVLISELPWLAAEVVHEGQAPGHSGTFRLRSCPEYSRPENLVIVRDASDICASYEEIVAARGPCSMLPVSALGPVVSFPERYEDSRIEPARAFMMQANFIRGGLLLDLAGQHNFMDGGGLFQCSRLLAKALRGERFSPAELKQGNRDRRRLIPLLGADEPLLDHAHLLRRRCPPSAPLNKSSRPPATWHFFQVPARQMASIKHRAASELASFLSTSPGPLPKDAIRYISTNDALCAFLWKRLSTARRRISPLPPHRLTKFSRAVDARRAMAIPKEYMGQMGFNASTRLSYAVLDALSLGQTAALLRAQVAGANTEYAVRSWATFIAQEPDKSRIMFGGEFDPETDVGVSSLAHVELYSEGFGGLGRPSLVRRPTSRPFEGCVYFWSRTEGGDLGVMACLNERDLGALRADEEWGEKVEYIG